ncbi:hypothetical protein GPECTOR_12g524 [Gonium pectorale]|uniref:Uncharacterized protein n=1 Tax=Gonium pectorale TaxID=33097 RepID=A0A150GP26_GONPE|nr:hypothetical protein GPECTOR_12g524 [Gonium pectorale]|eukprot:KXZ51561.1 hypothetical protein GPECTOR_12g524 [Gonium pectorale]
MRHKLQPVSRPGIFVGYERGSDAYCVQMPDGKVEVSANVTFDESPSGAAAAAAAAGSPDFDYTRVALVGEPVGETRTKDAGTAGTDAGAVGDAPAGTDAAPAGEEKPTPAAAPEPRRSPRFQVAVVAADVQIPASYKEALASPQSDEWVRAMEEELASLHEKQTWTLVPLPKGAKVIPTKWVYDVKCDASGQIERFKARLVAKGFKQRAGIDFDEVFAPASNPTTTRLLLAMVAAERMVLRQVDVKTAFLNGELDETIYVTQPQGEALWLEQLLAEFGVKASPIRIKTDNQGALSLIKHPVLTERSKHIDIQHHFVRERASRGEVAFEYCPTDCMVADMLTKPLGS